jgi:hypothetical protein
MRKQYNKILFYYLMGSCSNNSYLRYEYRKVSYYNTKWENCPTRPQTELNNISSINTGHKKILKKSIKYRLGFDYVNCVNLLLELWNTFSFYVEFFFLINYSRYNYDCVTIFFFFL